MKDFEFMFSTKVVFGRDVHKRIGEFAVQYGSRVMLLYGSQRIKRSGLLPDIIAQLTAVGIHVIEFGGIEENPTLAKAEEGCRLACAEKIDLLIAVGGGSVIDTAKAISVGSHYKGNLWNLYEGSATVSDALPIGVVLTIAATASEANCVSVLHNTQIGRKLSMTNPLTFPKFALMNPELTYTVPPYQTAAGSVDIFSHAFERYFHKVQTGTLRDFLCAGVMRTVITELPKALAHPDSYDARSQLMWAATVAHSNMLGFEGDFACHALSHVLTTQFGISHGAALGILMVAWCKYMLAEEEDAIAKFALQVWQVPESGKLSQTAQNGIFEFQNFICSVGLPVTLREAGFPDADPESLAEKAINPAGGFIGGNFKRLCLRDVISIFQIAAG